MQKDPQTLAKEVLGRDFADLEASEQRVLQRICSGKHIGLDADEEAQLQASRGDRLADRVAEIGGSWAFISGFGVVLFFWVLINNDVFSMIGLHSFDRYPFTFLNLILSMLAALQAPIIMMSQNRHTQKDRIAARHDYEVTLRTKIEIRLLSRKIDKILQSLDKPQP